MATHDDPLVEAQSNAQRMLAHAEEALESTEPDQAQSHVHDALRFGEQARGSLEEALDSMDDERALLHTEQALDFVEEALDRANQALISSESAMREHLEQMSINARQAASQIRQVFGLGIV